MDKRILMITAILVVFSTMACNRQSKKNEKNDTSPSTIVQANASLSQSAEKMYEKLLSSFGNDWMERESDPDLYPDYFGGAFVNNNGIFVVAVTSDTEENRKRLKKILGTDHFTIETVQYSYKQMMKVMDNIDHFLMDSSVPEDHPLLGSFAGAYPDVMGNRVKVLLTKVNDSTIAIFRKDVINSPLIIFEQGELPSLM